MAPTASRIPLARKRVEHNFRRRLKNSSATTTADGIGKEIRATTTDPHRIRNLHGAASSSDPSRLDVTGYSGAVYYVSMNVGKGLYRMIVDTGSTDIWVSCYYYDRSRCLDSCPAAAIKIQYGSGTVCVSTEILPIRIGSLVIGDYSAGVALSPNAQPDTENSILLGKSEGLLGLAFGSLATVESIPGYVVDYLDSFSVYLIPGDADDGSFLMLNGVDDYLIQQNDLVPYRLPLKVKRHWTVGLTSFGIGGDSAPIVPCYNMTAGSCDAIVDTGTTLVIIPPQVFKEFVTRHLLPAGCVKSNEISIRGLYICNGSTKLPAIQFTFGSMNFYLEMDNYVQHQGRFMLVEIQASTAIDRSSQIWVLGGTFLKQFYSSYENRNTVVLYCKEGQTCDKDGSVMKTFTAAPSAISDVGASGVESVSQLPSTASDQVTGTSSSGASQTTRLPGGSAGGIGTNSTEVSTSSSGGGHRALTIAIVASLVGLGFVVVVVVVVRRLLLKRQSRQHEIQDGMEMQTVASTGGASTAYVSGATLTPKGAGMN